MTDATTLESQLRHRIFGKLRGYAGCKIEHTLIEDIAEELRVFMQYDTECRRILGELERLEPTEPF